MTRRILASSCLCAVVACRDGLRSVDARSVVTGAAIPKVSVLDPECRGHPQAPRVGKPVVPPL